MGDINVAVHVLLRVVFVVAVGALGECRSESKWKENSKTYPTVALILVSRMGDITVAVLVFVIAVGALFKFLGVGPVVHHCFGIFTPAR